MNAPAPRGSASATLWRDFKGDDDSWLVELVRAAINEFHPERRLPCARSSGHDRDVAARETASDNRVETLDGLSSSGRVASAFS